MGGACLLSAPLTAEADVTSVTVDYQAPFPTYSGNEYTYVEATFTGTVPRAAGAPGNYSVGMVFIYPKNGGNKVGIVDWTNTVFFTLYGYFRTMGGEPGICPRNEPFCDLGMADHGQRLQNASFQFTRIIMEDFLWKDGYTYASVQWDKTVTDFFGPDMPEGRQNRLVFGKIDKGTDGYQILADVAKYLRAPTALTGVPAPVPVTKVISAGFSQTSGVQNAFIVNDKNVSPQGPIYDGFLLQGGGYLCWPLQDEGPPFASFGACPELPDAGTAKIMTVATQSDVQAVFAAALSRSTPQTPNRVQYELAGVAHISTQMLDAAWVGATRQNPADPRPFYRGALRNLTKWVVSGTTPPPSSPIDGTIQADGSLAVVVDADGNVTGGSRLPFVPSTVNGMPAGAPTGVYGGVEPAGAEPFSIILLIAGTYTRFADAEIQRRYPTAEVFQTLVTRSADKLLADGYILQADRDRYATQTAPLPIAPDPKPEPEPDSDNGCSTGSGSSSVAFGGILFAALLLRRRQRGQRQA
ncbi:MAG: alpha/beta hydrolase domain-containing protein [Myxococcota bacterium]|nr:alpha/beta hydrolase domain-containing protein [Myxococcota bacterium]